METDHIDSSQSSEGGVCLRDTNNINKNMEETNVTDDDYDDYGSQENENTMQKMFQTPKSSKPNIAPTTELYTPLPQLLLPFGVKEKHNKQAKRKQDFTGRLTQFIGEIINDDTRPRCDAEQLKQRQKEKRRSSLTNPGYVDKNLILVKKKSQNNKNETDEDEDEDDESKNKHKDDTKDDDAKDEYEFESAQLISIEDENLPMQCMANNSEDVGIVSISNMSKSPINSVCIILNLS